MSRKINWYKYYQKEDQIRNRTRAIGVLDTAVSHNATLLCAIVTELYDIQCMRIVIAMANRSYRFTT